MNSIHLRPVEIPQEYYSNVEMMGKVREALRREKEYKQKVASKEKKVIPINIFMNSKIVNGTCG